jgi:hypothetical protein
MSTNRNWELEHAYTLGEVRDYVKECGADNFLQDLRTNFPEVYMEIMEAANHRINSLNQKEVPALLRNYRSK